jgi:hypothetical protein
MPKLVQYITGTIYSSEVGTTYFTKYIEGQVGEGDYFKVFGLEVIQQDFSRVEDYEILSKSRFFGLNNQYRKAVIELSISK